MSITGTFLLVSGTSDQARAIQRFQVKTDPEAGIYNHSGILLQTRHDIYVVEQTQIKGRKLKAASRPTLLKHYQEGDYKLLYLKPAFEFDEKVFEQILMDHMAIPYDYFSLLHDQVLRTIHRGLWVGRKHGAWKRAVCHEFGQYIWNQYTSGVMFKDYYKGDIAVQFRSPYFTRDENLF